jgi:hypothetical protein
MSSRSREIGGEAELGEDRGEAWECWPKAKSHRLQRMKPGLRAQSSGIIGLQPEHSGSPSPVDPGAAAGLLRSS